MTDPTPAEVERVKRGAKAIHALHADWFGTPAWHVLDPQERAAFRDEAAAVIAALSPLHTREEVIEECAKVAKQDWIRALAKPTGAGK